MTFPDFNALAADCNAAYAKAAAHAVKLAQLQGGGSTLPADRAGTIAALRVDVTEANMTVERFKSAVFAMLELESDLRDRASLLTFELKHALQADGGLGETNPARAAREAKAEADRLAKNRESRARQKASRAAAAHAGGAK